jgi:hypothetical protein
MLNFTIETLGTIVGMHPTSERLYGAALRLKSIAGLTKIANLLGESPQAVKNWEARGVSVAGALSAQRLIGCDANWVISGNGSMTASWPFTKVSQARYLALDDTDKGYVERSLEAAIERCEQPPDKEPAKFITFDLAPSGSNKQVRKKAA